MYQVQERKMDILLMEATRLVDKLSHSSIVSTPDIKQFGSALLDVQTEVHRQKPMNQSSLFEERVIV